MEIGELFMCISSQNTLLGFSRSCNFFGAEFFLAIPINFVAMLIFHLCSIIIMIHSTTHVINLSAMALHIIKY